MGRTLALQDMLVAGPDFGCQSVHILPAAIRQDGNEGPAPATVIAGT
jgi:hypothetical protein